MWYITEADSTTQQLYAIERDYYAADSSPHIKREDWVTFKTWDDWMAVPSALKYFNRMYLFIYFL